MKFLDLGAIALAVLSQVTEVVAKHSHQHQVLHALEHRHRRHAHRGPEALLGRDPPATSPAEAGLSSAAPELKKRGGTCEFPSDAGLVSVAPGSTNAGWAIPPDQACKCGDYCPYACPPGEMMAQWDPTATSYTYPASMNGGLYCNDDGTVSKPFPSKPYCVKGVGNVGVKDKTGKGCAVCQTVLPGSESMLIPTMVDGWSQITVPGTDYWCETAAHFYINPPGVSTEEGCVWGTPENPYGNWSPYVAGANQDGTGNTFVKAGWNPKFTDGSAEFPIETPDWGISIECDGGGCNGLPCKIDPSKHKVNEMEGSSTEGAGDAAFCVVTVPEGSSANIVIFSSGGSDSDSGSSYSIASSSEAPSSSFSSTSLTSSTPKPSTSSAEPTTSSVLSTTSTTSSSSQPTTSSTPSKTSTSAAPSSTSATISSISSTSSSGSSSSSSTTTAYSTTTTTSRPSKYHNAKPKHTWSPHALHQNETIAVTGSGASSTHVIASATDGSFGNNSASATSPMASTNNTGMAPGKLQVEAATLALGAFALFAAMLL